MSISTSTTGVTRVGDVTTSVDEESSESFEDCNACSCAISCRNDPDDFVACADAPSGNAVPTCFTWNGPDSRGQCFFERGNGETRPDAMQCVDNLEAGIVAGLDLTAWVLEGSS